MVGPVLMGSTPTTATAIQVFMDPTVMLTTMSVHHLLVEMEEHVQMALRSIIVSVELVLQVCASVSSSSKSNVL